VRLSRRGGGSAIREKEHKEQEEQHYRCTEGSRRCAINDRTSRIARAAAPCEARGRDLIDLTRTRITCVGITCGRFYRVGYLCVLPRQRGYLLINSPFPLHNPDEIEREFTRREADWIVIFFSVFSYFDQKKGNIIVLFVFDGVGVAVEVDDDDEAQQGRGSVAEDVVNFLGSDRVDGAARSVLR